MLFWQAFLLLFMRHDPVAKGRGRTLFSQRRLIIAYSRTPVPQTRVLAAAQSRSFRAERTTIGLGRCARGGLNSPFPAGCSFWDGRGLWAEVHHHHRNLEDPGLHLRWDKRSGLDFARARAMGLPGSPPPPLLGKSRPTSTCDSLEDPSSAIPPPS